MLVLRCCFLCLWLSLNPAARAALQFDVFVGYDGFVREAGWFPIVCEVFNDGPSFQAVIEISSGPFGSEQTRQLAVELPTNTRKRLVVPMFAGGGRFSTWDAKLMDDRGRLQAERLNVQAKTLAWECRLLGAVSRTFGGLPTLPDLRLNRLELRPQVARMQLDQFPDNPIALEGLDVLYLNSEKALELKADRVAALLAWVRGGGHLIVAVEQPADINATPWLQQLVPCEISGVANVRINEALMNWLKSDLPVRAGGSEGNPPPQRGPFNPRPGRSAPPLANPFANLPVDSTFAGAEMAVATGSLRDGQVVLASGQNPLIIAAHRGRGKVTVLMFSPEREPFRSWKNRSYFWAKLLPIPPAWFSVGEPAAYGGWSVDGVFGALIDSRQVRKLPVEWLLLLLLVYLVVIGPFDQYLLKRIGRPMLTWLTFPAYVVFFSLLIYFIGYKLRAGETEWNELHLVDVLPRGTEAELRGRTYVSVYSSANAKYPLAGDQPYATLRGELLDLYGGGRRTASRAKVEQQGNGFRAEIFVPVWTSLLYVSDWLQPAVLPCHATVAFQESGWLVTVENFLDQPLTSLRLVLYDRVYDLGDVPARQKKAFPVQRSQAMALSDFVRLNGQTFQRAVEKRRNPLGDDKGGHLENAPLTAMVASFSSQLGNPNQYQRAFVAPPGLDLTPLVERGDAVLLAWYANHSFVSPLHQFKPPRLQRNTLLRLAVPVSR